MTSSVVDRIVAATLYEGYILYPYRPTSVKNQVRWTFGGVFPAVYADAAGGTERSAVKTECLLRGDVDSLITVAARFLHPVTRTVLQLGDPATDPGEDAIAAARPVPALVVGGRRHVSWDEATERSIGAGTFSAGELLGGLRAVTIAFAAGEQRELVRDDGGIAVGAIRRRWKPLRVTVEVGAERCAESLCRVRVRIINRSDAAALDRDAALPHALVSTHAVLSVAGGTWLSLADPPEDAKDAAARCANDGLWPALVGDGGVDDTVLASPIILEDHPRVAPESAGDLFDSTEIDEILSLRVLTLTDDEKDEMRAADARARALLERTESLTEEQFRRMHGTIRELRPVIGEPS